MEPGNAFEELDEAPLKRFHLLAVLTTGMGVFTDGYDLSSIGLVLPQVLASFGQRSLTSLQSALLTGSALVGAALGAIVFGVLAQRGRKRFYGVDVALMALAAAAQAVAPNLWSLIAIRFVLGVGVGADYVLSPTIMAEHANRQDRGKKIGFGFGVMWCLGAFVAALVLKLVQTLGISPGVAWRVVLAAGTLPAISVLSLRRKMPETARFLARLGGAADAAKDVIIEVTGTAPAQLPLVDRRAWREVLTAHARPVLGAAALWLVYDVVLYSNVLFGPSVIARSIGMKPVGFTLVTYGVFTIPGTLLGCALVDRWGRKALMAVGFGLSALALVAFAPLQGGTGQALGGLAIFGLFTFTLSLGPGAVSGSGILGVELSPTRIRSVAQAITVVGGRIGASLSAFVFPALLGAIGERRLLFCLAGTSLAGAVLSLWLVPETRGQSLEEINGDGDAALARAE